MPFTIADKLVARKPDGTTSPIAREPVRATASVAPLFYTPDGGVTWLEMAGSEVWTVTADDGSYSIVLPCATESDPTTVTWSLALPDNSIWAGPPQANGATYTVRQLKNLVPPNNWTLVQGPPGGPVSGIQGGPGLSWRGYWASGIAYNVGDAVAYGGSSYVCVVANTSSVANAPPGADWNPLALGGGTVQQATPTLAGVVEIDQLNANPSNPGVAVTTRSIGMATAGGVTGIPALDANATISGYPLIDKGGAAWNARAFGAKGDGVTDDGAAIQAAITQAASSTIKRVYLPGATYRVGTGATTGVNIFQLNATGLEVFGDGPQRTILSIAPNLALSGNLNVFLLTGLRNTVKDLTIQGSGGYSGGSSIFGVNIGAGAFFPHVARVECVGMYGGATAGGAGIQTYQPWNQAEVNTTLGTAVGAAGSVTCTPPSMSGIYVDRVLSVGGANPETIVVTAISATTFTATFAYTHLATDGLTGTSNGNQYALIEQCTVRDSYQATGMILNSCANVVRDCRFQTIGSNQQQHGVYSQGGNNLVTGCHFEGCAGASIHGHKAVNYIDSAGDRFLDNVSINPGRWHIILDTLTSDGTNPEIPSGQPLDRYALISGNVFRGRKNCTNPFGVEVDNTSAVITDNVFEDACYSNGRMIFGQTAFGLVIADNLFRQLDVSTVLEAILVGDRAVIRGNQFLNWSSLAIVTGKSAVIAGNRFELNCATNGAIQCDASSTIADNYITQSGVGDILAFVTGATGILVHDNTISSANRLANLSDSTLGVTFRGNQQTGGGALRYNNGSHLIKFVDNDVPISLGGNAASSLGPASSRAVYVQKDTSVIAGTGYLVKWNGASPPQVTLLATTDTSFFGVTTSGALGTAGDFYVAASVGAELWNVQTDGAWTAGHIGIPSTTSAAKLHDTGSATPPTSGSYVLFLDTGAAAGGAKVLVLKTL